MDKQQILIVDDEEINRAILSGVFMDEYEILEAGNGYEATAQLEANDNIVLILLDVVMPGINGFGVLEYMQEHGLIEKIPVILITGETIIDSDDQAYSFGVADVMHKPFYPHIVRRRGKNIIELYLNKRNMEKRLKEQEEEIRAKEKKIRDGNEFMIDALSSVIEFRNLETGEHIRQIKSFTRIMLKHLMKQFPEYGLTPVKADEIVRASVLHDIGKIGIPDAILLKPGRLTPEEFEIMKSHTTIGCELLEKFHRNRGDDFYHYCYDICRYHHERRDGNGYPDHLKGDEIPISAQVVSIVDVYDALISSRVYKDPYANNVAYDMIINGECGQFSPDILKCFTLAKDDFFNIAEVHKMFDLS